VKTTRIMAVVALIVASALAPHVDNVTLYWLTNTAVSSARLYWENKLAFFAPQGVTIPVAVSAFPDELYQAPRSWAERAFPKLIYYHRAEKGATSRPGSSQKPFRKNFARASGRYGRETEKTERIGGCGHRPPDR
jgi:hypothetical protein